jgi:6-pyruvoyltetrahydropterin/6-carboxytetrahydropterin synthase
MPAALFTREVRFSAAHRYFRPDWSEERNRATFGACANPHGHGHLYRLEVTVGGEVAEDTGFAVDLSVLDDVLEREVTSRLDHQFINHVVPEFGPGRRIPTTENLLVWLWPRVQDALPSGVQLRRMLLREDDGLYAEYFGGALP